MKLIYGLLAGVVVALVAGVGFESCDRRHAAQDHVLRDSLTLAQGQAVAWGKVAAERKERYDQASGLLDSLLRAPARTVYVTRTRVDTVSGDTVTSQVPYIPQADFDTLKVGCRNVQVRCDSVVAAKDSVIAKDSVAIKHATALWHSAEDAVTRERHKGWLRTVRDVVIGALACKLAC